MDSSQHSNSALVWHTVGFSGLSLLASGLAGADAAVGGVGTGEGRGDRDRDLSSWALCAMWLACRPLVFLVGGALDTELWHWTY